MQPPVLVAGDRVRLVVPGSSGNLGPGFDCLGLALDACDEMSVEVIDSRIEVLVSGEGAGAVPNDASHLVVRMVLAALDEFGARAGGLRLTASNNIPHGRGLGSSAAAIVAGLAAGWLLAHPGDELDRRWVLQRATEIEGHPDNAAASLHGGVVAAWVDAGVVDHMALPVHPDVRFTVWVPEKGLATVTARAVLPEEITRRAAVDQVSRVAALVLALQSAPQHLLFATEDHLHQPYRGALMPESARLVADLRRAGVPAVVSGAGPSVLAIGTAQQLEPAELVDSHGFARHDLRSSEGLRIVR